MLSNIKNALILEETNQLFGTSLTEDSIPLDDIRIFRKIVKKNIPKKMQKKVSSFEELLAIYRSVYNIDEETAVKWIRTLYLDYYLKNNFLEVFKKYKNIFKIHNL